MRFLIFFLFVTLFSSFSKEDRAIKIKVIKHPKFALVPSADSRDNTNEYYKIAVELSNKTKPLYYDKDYYLENFTELEIRSIIEQLLELQGDTRICSDPVLGYGHKVSSVISPQSNQYSIQIEALFIITMLTMENPFDYAPMPILKNYDTGEEWSIGGKGIEDAFDAYRRWVEIIKKSYLEKSKDIQVQPLDGTKLRWFRG